MQYRHKLEKQFICKACPKKIIIDIKGGLEDIQALVVAFHLSKKYNKEIIGITCVGGEVQSTEGARLDALVACKISGVKVPVYQGSQQSMLLKTQGSKVFGREGSYEIAKQLRVILQHSDRLLKQEQSGISFMVAAAKSQPQNLGIICLGPLTNIAIAYHLDYSFGKIQMLSIYGGQFTGVGNVIGQYSSEANFKFDPQAAHIVVKNFSDNIYLNPLQNAIQFNPGELFQKELRTLIEKSSKKKYLERLLLSKNIFSLGWGQILAVFAMFNPHSVKTIYHVYGEVSLQLSHIEGFLAIDWLKMQKKQGQDQANIHIFSKFNNQYVTSAILQMVADEK